MRPEYSGPSGPSWREIGRQNPRGAFPKRRYSYPFRMGQSNAWAGAFALSLQTFVPETRLQLIGRQRTEGVGVKKIGLSLPNQSREEHFLTFPDKKSS